MSLFDWLFVGAVASIVKKYDSKIDYEDYNSYESNKESFDKIELERIKKVNEIRSNSFVNYDEGISEETFEILAKNAASHFKRIVNIEVYGLYIYCTVESQSGASEWEFEVDFNDWGHITGVFWTPYNENDDSTIASKYGLYLSSLIHDYMDDHDLYIKDFSDYIDKNNNLCRSKLSYHPKENPIKKYVTKRYKSYSIGFDYDELIGEHVYVVTSIFRNLGFNNIYVLEAKESHIGQNNKKEFEVFKITINGEKIFKGDVKYKENDEIKIFYYGKKQIQSLKSSHDYKNCNYTDVAYELHDLGFAKIYTHAINDIKIGLLKKDESVETVHINDKPIEKNKKYFYDSKIDIYYHSK